MTNIATMEIEIIIGVIGAIGITGAFYKRESNRKKARGERLTKANINSIIPLRYRVRLFLDFLKKEFYTTEPQNEKQQWGEIQKWKSNLTPLFVISGDFITTEQQVLIGKILADLEKDLSFKFPEIDQSQIHGLDIHLTDYLKMNKDIVIEVFNDSKKEAEKRIENIRDPDAEIWKTYKKNILQGIKENEDIIKDIISDKS